MKSEKQLVGAESWESKFVPRLQVGRSHSGRKRLTGNTDALHLNHSTNLEAGIITIGQKGKQDQRGSFLAEVQLSGSDHLDLIIASWWEGAENQE